MSRESTIDLMKQGYTFKHPSVAENIYFYYSKNNYFDTSKYGTNYANRMLIEYPFGWQIYKRYKHLDYE